MIRSSALPLCAGTLLVGYFIGAGASSFPVASSVRADPAPESSRVYNDLDARNPLAESSAVLARIAALATPSVVHIQSERPGERRGTVEETGSGVIVTHPKSNEPLVLTNRHVVAGPSVSDDRVELKSVSIQLSDGRVVHPTKVLSDRATDVAVLRLPNLSGVTPVLLGNSDELQIGNLVLAMGSPFGLSRSVTLGIISAKGRRSLKLGSDGAVLNQDFLQTDAAINPGNSGGPLIDLHGRVVGINTAIASNSGGNDGIGFSIPSNLARQVMDQLLTNGRVQRAYLGVKLDPDFDIAAAQRLRLDRPRGARVVEVYPNTPASRAALRFDDVVLTFDGTDVQDENHLINLVSLTPVGREVSLVVQREGRRVTLPVLLSDRSELEQRAEPERPGVGTPVRPMGLTVHQLDRTIAPQLGFAETQQGLVVLSIDPQSPLSADVQLYDVIVEAARTPVRTPGELNRVIEQHRDARSIALRVHRRENGRLVDRIVVWTR